MSPTPCRSRRSWTVPFLVAAVVALSAGCAARGTADGASAGAAAGTDSSASPSTPASADRDENAVRITLVVGSGVTATATLADTPEARAFAAALPMTIAAEDRFGQAKAGRLPYELGIDAAGPRIDPAAGGLY
jgi:hypothetical protein